MRLNVKALALTLGCFCGLAMLIVGLANLIWPPYGRALLDVVASVYPGYQASAGIGSVIVATLYGFVDGAIGGALFAWLYNTLARRGAEARA